MVKNCTNNKTISAQSWGLAGWLELSLAKMTSLLLLTGRRGGDVISLSTSLFFPPCLFQLIDTIGMADSGYEDLAVCGLEGAQCKVYLTIVPP